MKLLDHVRGNPKSWLVLVVVVASIFLGQDFLNWGLNVVNAASGIALEAH